MYKFKLIFAFLVAIIIISCERDELIPEADQDTDIIYSDTTFYSPTLVIHDSQAYSPAVTREFDFDNDGAVDLKFIHNYSATGSSLNSSNSSSIEVTNTSLQIACTLTADTIREALDTAPATYDLLTTFNTYPPYVSAGTYAYDTVTNAYQTYYPAPLGTSTIDSTLDYINQPSYILRNYGYNLGIVLSGIKHDYQSNFGLFRNSSTKYIDFRINKTDGYHYGYIKLSVSGYISIYEIYYRH